MTLDRRTIMQIFGSIMQKPSLLSEVENYSLVPSDFETVFERYTYIALANLSQNGANKISVVDVDNYLNDKPAVYEIFSKNGGIEYLQDAEELADVDNFDYYYTKFKKYCALKDLKKMGYDTNKIYPDGDMLSDKEYELREKFENLSVEDIFNKVKGDLSAAEAKYGCSAAETTRAVDGIKSLIESLGINPEIGAPCQGDIFNTITRGARLGKFYLMSAASGGSKTRTMVGNACYIAYPIRYDSTQQKWVHQGSCEKVLYVGTEQVCEEIQTMIIAYLTDLNEEIILSGRYTSEQRDLIDKAIQIMKAYEDNFTIVQLPEPNLGQVKTLLRHHCLNNGCRYVFYDYIFATPSLLNEFRDLAVRADVALRMLSTLLKDLAVELDCFIMSATQITGSIEFKVGYIRNYLLLRDSKSIPDKADFAAIKAKVLPEETNLLQGICNKLGVWPNQVTDVYKMRRGRWVDVRIWSYADLGTCRTKDLFITDANLNIIKDFTMQNMVIDYESVGEIDDMISLFNVGEVTGTVEESLEETEQLPWEGEERFEKEQVIAVATADPNSWGDFF